jgi:hypothetical protein
VAIKNAQRLLRGMAEKINDDQRCSLVFVKVKREWKLAAEHCTQIVSK